MHRDRSHQLPCATGFRVHQDKLDGYLFFVPENWIPVTVRRLFPGLLHVLDACCRPDMHVLHIIAELWQRHLLPQPLQRERELVCGCVVAIIIQLYLSRRPGAAGGCRQAHA